MENPTGLFGKPVASLLVMRAKGYGKKGHKSREREREENEVYHTQNIRKEAKETRTRILSCGWGVSFPRYFLHRHRRHRHQRDPSLRRGGIRDQAVLSRMRAWSC